MNVGIFLIPAGTASIKVIGGADGTESLSPRVQIQEKIIPGGQSMTTFSGVPTGWFWIDAWSVNSVGVPIAQGWGDAEVVQGQTSAASVPLWEVWFGGSNVSWFHGRVKWNGRATVTYADAWEYGCLSGSNGEFYIAVPDMTSSRIATLECWGFQDKQIALPLTAAGTVRELGDIAVVPETPAPAPLPRERVLEWRRAMEQ